MSDSRNTSSNNCQDAVVGGVKASMSQTPTTSKLADLLIGLKDSGDDLPVTNTPVAPAVPVAVESELADNCNCRKSRCLKL
mgnify:CR=1 FL=1